MTQRADYPAPTKDAARLREYRKTERYRELKRIESKRWRLINRDKRNVHAKVGRAIKAGKLVRPGSCSDCGIKTTPVAHHHDYSKPLDVTWLCHNCHNEVHNARG